MPRTDATSFRDRALFGVGALVGALIIRLLSWSTRVRVLNPSGDPLHPRSRGFAPGDVPIYVSWHQRMFAFFDHLGPRHVAVMISRSRDGEMISRAAQHLGFRSVRGSSTRGGVPAMREILGILKRRRPIGFLADGPLGPPGIVKTGVIAASRETGDPIVPLAWGGDRVWTFKSWDRYKVPKPFSRVVLVVGDSIRVPAGADRAQMERARQRLGREIDRLCAVADTYFTNARKESPLV